MGTPVGNRYRTQAHARQLLGHGAIALRGVQGEVAFRNLAIERLGAQARNEADISRSLAFYVISVRRTRDLLTASFRFHLTVDTLAVRLYTSHYLGVFGTYTR